MNIAVDGKNFFHTGWVACLLGLPKIHPGARALKPSDLAAFEDGWEMCEETGRSLAFDALIPAVEKGQISVCWVNDDNEEI